MILVDTSVWVDHLRNTEPVLLGLLSTTAALCHPFVIGELALGGVPQRGTTLGYLKGLPQAPVADPDAVLRFIESRALSGTGIGYVDAHLLAAARSAGATVWTRDRRLRSVSRALGLIAALP
jgi:predicted nucleic acid-binding protein